MEEGKKKNYILSGVKIFYIIETFVCLLRLRIIEGCKERMKNFDDILQQSEELFNRAFALQMEGKYEEAIANYKSSIDLYPTAKAHTYLGWAYSYLKNYDAAIEECKNAINIDPEYGNPYNDIGAYLIKLGNYDEALIWLEFALEIKDYQNPEFVHLNIGKVYEIKGMWFDSLYEYKKALELAPDFITTKKLIDKIQGFLN